MKNIVIAGSSGMIGNLVLQLSIDNKEINKITIINRKPSNIKNAKVMEVIHQDFLNFEPIKNVFSNQDICYYCIGVYTGQVPTDEFNKITIEYTKCFARVLKEESPNAIFCFLSGQGADSKEKSKILFAKAKGIAENILFDLKFYKTYIFRPGYIYPTNPRKEPNFSYKIMKALYKPVSFMYPNIGLTSIQLANKMLAVGLYGNETAILENKELRS
jgi:nucleoside-diphosphate-sugar epimerase